MSFANDLNLEKSKILLILSQTANLDSSKVKEFTDNNFKFYKNGREFFQTGRKYGGKKGNCSLKVIASFPTEVLILIIMT